MYLITKLMSYLSRDKSSALHSFCIITFALLLAVFSHAGQADTQEQLSRLLQSGDYQLVIDKLEQTKDKTARQYNLLISAQMNVDLDDAEESAEAFIRDYSDDYRAYHMHANVMGAQASGSIFSALGYAKKAKQSLETAVQLAPQELAVYQALMQFHIVAPSIAGGDMDEAKKLVEKIEQLNELEGAFARASFLAAEEKTLQAKQVLTQLSEQPQAHVRALYELGNLHIQNEQYDEAFDVLSPLLSASVEEAERADEKAWNAYSNNKFSQLYGTYRIGWLAVKTDQYTQPGINALTHYLNEIETTDIDTQQLPTKNWANLRLAELFMQADNMPMAQQTIARITEDGDKRLIKILKQLKKQLKKRT